MSEVTRDEQEFIDAWMADSEHTPIRDMITVGIREMLRHPDWLEVGALKVRNDSIDRALFLQLLSVVGYDRDAQLLLDFMVECELEAETWRG